MPDTREIIRSLVQAKLQDNRFPHRIPKVANSPTDTKLDFVPNTRKRRRRASMDRLVNNNGQYLRVDEPRK